MERTVKEKNFSSSNDRNHVGKEDGKMFIELHDWEGNPTTVNINSIKAVMPYKENKDSARNLGKGNSLIEYTHTSDEFRNHYEIFAESYEVVRTMLEAVTGQAI
jgi:hypothetical protein